MSLCNPCTKVKTIPTCVTSIVIGTIANLSTAVHVYIRDTTTDGYPVRFDVTSSGAGLVTINVEDYEFMPDHSYELWITLANSTSIDTRLNITIASTAYTCLGLHFNYVKDEDFVNIEYTSQTLAIA